jgi:multidrug efflux pump subunit AcrA (membrane-fusion protein)
VIRTGQIPKAVVVPASAVQFEEGTHNGTAFVVDGQHVAHKRDVEGGAIVSDGVVVTKGIEAGEMVVVEGGYGLPDKTQVTLPGDPKK